MANYYIHDQQLQIVDNAKYLGLTISKNLSWNNHVNNITKKANSTLAFLRRNIQNCPQRIRHRPTTHSYDHHLNMPLLCGIHILRPTSIKQRASNAEQPDSSPTTTTLEPQIQCYNTTTRPQLAHPTTQTPTSQTHHDVPHYLPSHRNTIYYLSHSIQTRYQRTHHPIPTTFNQSASISILLPQHHQIWNNLPQTLVSSGSIDIFRHSLTNTSLP